MRSVRSEVLVVYAAAMNERTNDPLHGKPLKTIMEQLVEYYGWEELGKRIVINCFTKNPSIPSSLKFLRKTPWARKKVEELYLRTHSKLAQSPSSS